MSSINELEKFVRVQEGLVVNTDANEYLAYVQKREILKNQSRTIDNIKSKEDINSDRINNLEDKLSNIESMLQQLLSKAN